MLSFIFITTVFHFDFLAWKSKRIFKITTNPNPFPIGLGLGFVLFDSRLESRAVLLYDDYVAVKIVGKTQETKEVQNPYQEREIFSILQV